jgi:hypothetical protein
VQECGIPAALFTHLRRGDLVQHVRVLFSFSFFSFFFFSTLCFIFAWCLLLFLLCFFSNSSGGEILSGACVSTGCEDGQDAGN